MALDPITAALNFGNSLIERLIPDKAAQEAAKAALLQMQIKGEFAQLTGQLEINKAEAENPNWFVAGWRPAVGWICAAACGSEFLVRPLLTWGAALWGHAIAYPSLDIGSLLTLLLGMLGLSWNRTQEKIQNVQANH